ncbi:thymidylate kinase-like [Haliotis rufescens]|uniref:thymidylate kinase-like n=1 Tax=Haliotis rufescens TaxID=6454 RepID=UPI001EB01C7C|nr:thymidylate kinase-like [Haliotis rufescens]
MKMNRSLLCGYGKGRGLPITPLPPTIQFWRLIRNRLMSVSTMKGRGALIVFEGCDRCGKTTQCNLLLEKLTVDGTPVKLMKFPDRTTVIGQMINGYLQKKAELDDHAVHLLFSANRWECVKDINQLLNGGTTLIVDRYAFSGVAFTAAKKGFTLDWCKQPDIGLPSPDKVLYMTLTSEAAGKRAGFGGERYEQEDFQKRVAENFEKLQDETWQRIDADKTIEDLHKELYAIVKLTIEEARNKKIDKLWVE